jgi:hypothetical protein
MTVENFRSLLSSRGLSGKDLDDAMKAYSEGISAASKSSRGSAATTQLSGTVLENIAKAAAPGFYDRLGSTQARINVDTIQTMVTQLASIPSFNPFEVIKSVLNVGAAGLNKIMGDFAKLNDNLIENTRGSAGYVGEVSDGMINGLREAVIATTRLGVSVDDFLAATKALMDNSERMVLYSEETIYAGMEASMAYTKSSKTLLENAEAFRNVGIGLADASKNIEEIGNRSISVGLSAKATSETLIKNLGALNQYGFQNGVKGLGKMVQEAQALKINMDETLKIADKLYDPESAITLAANLQVVGGAFGDLGDPIKLMYDATNNVESLQTSIIGAARSLATYNVEQGRFEVTGVNLRRAKAMADALGMSMGELTNMAVKGASKFEAMSQLDLFPDLTDDQKEFVSNLSTIKDGRVGFDLPDDIAKKMGLTNLNEGFIALDDLSGSQILEFKRLQENVARTNTVDLARNQLNQTTQMASTVSAIYLRMMEDGRRSSVGQTALETNQKINNALYENFDASKMTTPQMLDKAYQMAKDTLGGNITDVMKEEYEKMKAQLPEVGEYIDRGIDTLKNASENINLPEMFENLKKELGPIAEPVIERGKEFLKELGITVRVDLNSTSPELAEMFVAEIDRNPKLKSDLAGKIFGNKREYT